MDSQLASVLTSGSLDVQNGSRCSGGSLLVTQESPHAEPSPRGPAGDHHPSSVKTIRQDAVSINGKKPAMGGTYRPASQETSRSAGPIRAKTAGTARHSQPIRIKIVVPSHSKPPIRSSNMLLTKDFTRSAFSRPLLLKTIRNSDNIPLHAVKKEQDITEVAHPKTEPLSVEDERHEDLLDAKVIHTDSSSDTLSSSISAAQILSQQRIKEESVGEELEENIPLCLQEIYLTSLGSEEQTEPLDLSLPKKSESREQRYGCFFDDFGFESSLIMEVDEYDGEGDRDVVEEDNEHSLLSASFLSASVDTENHLFIDDQGIPYTLNQEGVKVPQVDTPSSYQVEEQEEDRKESSHPEAHQTPSSVQSLEVALKTPCDSPAPAANSDSSPPDSQMMITQIPQTNIPEPEAVVSKPSRISVQSQPLQILTSPSSNASILLVSSSPQLSTAPLSLPLSVAPSGASTPMFLLLSSVASSTGESTSTPIAVLDPSTGQLSQITAASAPVSLPLTACQVSPLSSLSSSCPPACLPGLTHVNASSPLTSLPQNDHTPLGTQAISGGDDSNEKPSTATPAAPSTETQQVMDEPNSETETSNSEPKFDTEQLPLNDHIYFSNAAASPSLNLSPGHMDAQDQLESHSPSGSPNSLASRRVLYCQLCPRVFFYLSDLERHAITHSQKKPHVCQQCGKAFKRSSHLQRHKHIHTGQRNFVCTICTKRFREAGELQRHQRVHTGEKPYQCQLCHTRFAERNTLRRHTKRKHPFHQAAMNMLSEKSDCSGAAGAQEDEETAEWYSSTVSNFDNYDLDMDS
ncbi:uncharacterized protein ACB058_019658 isoform 1-T2 [Synchiropus picturatus]